MSFRVRPDRHVRPGAPGAGAARRWERAEMTPDRDRWMRRCSTYTHSAWTCTARTPSPPLGRSGVAILLSIVLSIDPDITRHREGKHRSRCPSTIYRFLAGLLTPFRSPDKREVGSSTLAELRIPPVRRRHYPAWVMESTLSSVLHPICRDRAARITGTSSVIIPLAPRAHIARASSA
jgi:hypothetical protein